MSEKKYIKGLYIKEVEGRFGKEMKVSIKIDELNESLEGVSKNGWANVKFLKRKEISEKGNTHYVIDDTFTKTQEVPKEIEVNGNVLDKDNLPF